MNLWISKIAFCSLSIITASNSLSAKHRRFRIRSVRKNREEVEEEEVEMEVEEREEERGGRDGGASEQEER